MAGFLKRIFSFGKKKVEETPDPAHAEVEPVEVAVGAADEVVDLTSPVATALSEPEPEPEPDFVIGEDDDEARQAKEDASPRVATVGFDGFEAAPEPEPDVSRGEAEPEAGPEPEPASELVRDETRGSVTIGDEPKAGAPTEAEPEQPTNWFSRLRSGLSRSSKQLTENISGVFTKRKLDDETLEELEDILIQADLGVETAMRITDSLSSGRYGRDVSTDEVRRVMGDEISKVLDPVAQALELDLSHRPHVVLVVGVNGTGKTTTIGKLAAKLRDAGLSVTLGAGDTFRAAAIEQLKIWAERTGSAFVGTKLGADAAGLAYGAYETARDNGSDVVIIDTAGRLQNKTELMDELAKIVRVLQKHDPEAPHTVLQTLDATTGQNALNQVEIFRNIAGVNGLVMTKLDGTARGGILVAIAAKFKLPVYFIGVGEGIDDLEPFRAQDFSTAIVGGDMTREPEKA
ncbi:MAG: signal recognition particle-docking protein FtsY [Pseudomonadota bacterium]